MRNISVIPVLPVGGARVFTTTTSQQGFCADDFKAKASALPRQQFHESVQAFGVASSVAIGEVVEDGIAPTFGSQHQRQESIEDFRRDLILPCKVAVPCFIERYSFVHLEKCFLLCVGQCQAGKVAQPRFYDQTVFLREIVSASEQQVAVMHQSSTLFVGKPGSYLLTDGLKTSVKQLQHVELIHNQVCMWQDGKYCIMVGLPHIGANDLNVFLHCLGQALQILYHGFFASIPQKIDDAMILHVTEYTTVLVQQIQFIYPQTGDWCTRPIRGEVSGKFTKQQANTCLCQSDLIGDAHKGSAQCLLLNVIDQAVGAKMVLVHIGKFLKERSATATAPEAAAQDGNPYALASDGQVHVELRFDFVPVELLVFTEGTTKRRKETFRLDVQVMFIFVYRQDTKACQFENIQQPLSLHQELPHKFSCRSANPVLEKAELSDKIPTVSTHFCDVEHAGRGVKIGSIPRTFAISPIVLRIKKLPS